MASRFKVSTLFDRCQIAVVGAIDDGIGQDLASLRIGANVETLVFDMSRLTTINSRGCMEWVRALPDLIRGREVEFDECPVPFIDYANFHPEMLGPPDCAHKVSMQSFYAPYHCGSCNDSFEYRIVPSVSEPEAPLPAVRCLGCGRLVQSEVDPEDYLAFMSRPPLVPGQGQ